MEGSATATDALTLPDDDVQRQRLRLILVLLKPDASSIRKDLPEPYPHRGGQRLVSYLKGQTWFSEMIKIVLDLLLDDVCPVPIAAKILDDSGD